MASIKDISRELGLGVSTVSMALNDNPKISQKTRDLVHSKAKELKYIKNGFAIDLVKRKTNLILLVLHDASRAFFSRVIRELQVEVSRVGYDLIISTTYGGHSGTAEKYIKEKRTDAVIVFTKTIPDELLNECASKDFPIFVLGHDGHIDNEYVKSFQFQDATSANLIAADYLISLGHKRIAYVKGFHESYGTINGVMQFTNSMKNNGINVDETMFFDADGNNENDGYLVAKNDIAKRYKDFSALIFANDDIAIGALRAFKELSIRVPEDISVVGNHNIPQSAITTPPLTTFSTDTDYEFFYRDVIDLLVGYIEKNIDKELEKKINKYRTIEYIVERESVKKLK